MADVNVDKTLKTILLDTALVNLPKSISPKMHPKDHISTPFVYLPKKDRTSLRKASKKLISTSFLFLLQATCSYDVIESHECWLPW